MRAELGLPSVRGDDEKGGGMMGGFGGSMGGVGQGGKSKRPISVKFEIPYFTTSGIQVRYLKIIEPKVRGFPASSHRSFGSVRSRSLSLVGRRCGVRGVNCDIGRWIQQMQAVVGRPGAVLVMQPSKSCRTFEWLAYP